LNSTYITGGKVQRLLFAYILFYAERRACAETRDYQYECRRFWSAAATPVVSSGTFMPSLTVAGGTSHRESRGAQKKTEIQYHTNIPHTDTFLNEIKHLVYM